MIRFAETKRRLVSWLRRLQKKRVTLRELEQDLGSLGIRQGGILMVHSSLSSIGNVVGGAEDVIQACLAAVGDGGTLVMPSHSWRDVNAGSRQFSVRDTPSCVGAISETFRSDVRSVRSIHPSHSVAAVGSLATQLVEEHENDGTPCGSGTPYGKMMDREAQVLFLGVDLSRNTLFHAVETIAGLDYSLDDKEHTFDIQDIDGRCYQHRFRLHRQNIPRRFAEMEAPLVERNIVAVGRVGLARTLLLDAASFRTDLLEMLVKEPSLLRAQGSTHC